MNTNAKLARTAGLLAPGQVLPVDNVAAFGVWSAFGLSVPIAYVQPDYGMYCWLLAAVVPSVLRRLGVGDRARSVRDGA